MIEKILTREVAVFLRARNLFGTSIVPILEEFDTEERERPCVVVRVENAGRLHYSLPVKNLIIELLAQRNETEADLSAEWMQKIIEAIDQGSFAIAQQLHAAGWLMRGFALQSDAFEGENKRASRAEAVWRIVCQSV